MSGPSDQPSLTILRDTDRDRYLACLLLPEAVREDVAALYAFNAETARIRDIVREPLPGEVRLQFWRDLVEGNPHGDALASPIARGLMGAVDRHRLPRQTLAQLCEARIFDLYDDPIENTGQFELYAGQTASALIQLTSLILDPEHAAANAEAAGHAGVAQAVAGALLLLPTHRARGQLYLPLDILAATGLDREGFLAGTDQNTISAAISAFAGYGLDHLAKARAAAKTSLTPALAGAFLTVSLAQPVLDRAGRMGAAVLDGGLQSAQWRRQWRLWRASVNKGF